MLDSVIELFKSLPGVVGWINRTTLEFARMLGLERLEGQKIVSLDQHVVEHVAVTPYRRVMTRRRFFDEDTRFGVNIRILADPS
jgi:hypothetical protein